MNREIYHHCFTLNVMTLETCKAGPHWVPILDFDESDSFEQILLTMLHLEDEGICVSLTCDTWSEYEKIESEESFDD